MSATPLTDAIVDKAYDISTLINHARELERALVACVAVAKAWHGPDVWDIYYNHSPEMKPIGDVLGELSLAVDKFSTGVDCADPRIVWVDGRRFIRATDDGA